MALASAKESLEFNRAIAVACVKWHLVFLMIQGNYLFIWLLQVLVEECRIFSCSMWTLSCSMWDLVPWAEIEPRPLALVEWNLSHWTTRDDSEVAHLDAVQAMAKRWELVLETQKWPNSSDWLQSDFPYHSWHSIFKSVKLILSFPCLKTINGISMLTAKASYIFSVQSFTWPIS